MTERKCECAPLHVSTADGRMGLDLTRGTHGEWMFCPPRCPEDCVCHTYMPTGRVCSWCQQEGHEDDDSLSAVPEITEHHRFYEHHTPWRDAEIGAGDWIGVEEL